MKTVFIERYSSTINGVQSHVQVGTSSGAQTWHGLERPWLDNLPFESCIPTGTYALLPWKSPKYGDCRIFIGGEVGINKGDGERFACLIHPANYTRQLQGCLALGKNKADYYESEKSSAVWSSRDAVNAFSDVLGDEPAQAIISWKMG